MQAYKKLEDHFSQITALSQVESLLDWDKSVMMPEKGTDQRARQLSVVAVKAHEMTVDPKVGEWLAAVDEKNLDDWQRANMRVMGEKYTHATAVSADLIARRMSQDTITEALWRKAKAKSDFKMVLPELEKTFALAREYAQAKADKLGVSPYEAMMVHYAPHMTTAEVDVVFDDLAAFLPSLLDEVLGKQKDPLPLQGPFPIEKQKEAGLKLAKMLGMDESWSRLDVSAHPFSTGIGNDVRITSRYKDDEFISALQCVVHEAGHGFYDHHVPQAFTHLPVGASQNMGMAIHESQSLGLEMQMARSAAFWDAIAPMLREVFGQDGAAWSAENLHAHSTRVSRSFIRFEADEVTYPAHVILRYRLERQMIEGKLAVKDLPEAWAAQMKELIGVVPPDDAHGCLQDIHWHCGAIGYFPAYALGAVIAAQFCAKMKRDIPALDDHIRKGEFGVFVNWLKDNVQSKACLMTPPDLIKHVTGEGMTATHLKTHLKERYLG